MTLLPLVLGAGRALPDSYLLVECSMLDGFTVTFVREGNKIVCLMKNDLRGQAFAAAARILHLHEGLGCAPIVCSSTGFGAGIVDYLHGVVDPSNLIVLSLLDCICECGTLATQACLTCCKAMCDECASYHNPRSVIDGFRVIHTLAGLDFLRRNHLRSGAKL